MKINILIIALLIFKLCAGLNVFAQIEASLKDDEQIIATVDGVPIHYKDIKCAAKNVALKLKLLKPDNGNATFSETEIETEKLKIEKENLKNKIHNMILENFKIKSNIVVSQAEVEQRWNDLLKGVNVEKEVMKQNHNTGLLSRALSEVYDNKKNKDTVYEEILANQITPLEWEVQLNYYNTAERRKILKDFSARTPEEFRAPDLGIKLFVESEKINQAIDQEAEKLGLGPIDQKGTQEDEQSLNSQKLLRRKEWFRKRCTESNIEIKDTVYSDVLQSLTVQSGH
jgi:hypothetical protein